MRPQLSRYFPSHVCDTGPLLLAFIMHTWLTCLEFPAFVSASSVLATVEANTITTALGYGPPLRTVLSPGAQWLVNQTIAWQKGTGYKWNTLAAEPLLTLVKDVETNGWPSSDCTLAADFGARNLGLEWEDV
jgi:hypothetical protein